MGANQDIFAHFFVACPICHAQNLESSWKRKALENNTGKCYTNLSADKLFIFFPLEIRRLGQKCGSPQEMSSFAIQEPLSLLYVRNSAIALADPGPAECAHITWTTNVQET